MSVSIRQATPLDLADLGLCNLDPLVENYDAAFYISYMAKWPDMFIVAENTAGHIVGYIMGKVESSPPNRRFSEHFLPWHGHITALTVSPQYRRLGLGRVLSLALEKACEKRDALFMDLFVRESNPAVEMYRRMGYSVYRRVVDYYSENIVDKNRDAEDAFDMRKVLRAGEGERGKYIREKGEDARVSPDDIWGY